MHSLGAFFGHIAQGIKANPAQAAHSSTPASLSPKDPHAAPSDSDRQEISRNVQETEQLREDGERVILRRTVIEEVEIRRADAGNT